MAQEEWDTMKSSTVDTLRVNALVIEDAPEFVTILTTLLERQGFDVAAETTGHAGVERARAQPPDLVLLDVSLPDMDGFDVCRSLREFTDAYVVMLTARTEEIDKIVGLEVGADDYVTKPFSPRELTARIKAIRRRPRAAAEPELRDFGRLTIDPEAREVHLDGAPVDLTRLEFDILNLLSGSPRRAFTRAQLMEQVWGSTWYEDDHVIDVHMGNLRRKLGETGSSRGHVRTVRGVGYRFEPAGPPQDGE